MQSLQSRRPLLCLVAGAVLASLPGAGLAQNNAASQTNATKVSFLTADQVKLRGLYLPSTKKSEGPCAILLHDLGGNIKEKGWDSLAAALHKQGFAVLWFDFRGHGQSTSLEDPMVFWANPVNQKLAMRGYRGNRRDKSLPDTIALKAFNAAYLPYLINDIAAAKVFLDNKNDVGECNSSNTVLIGAGQGATLGALWLKAERYRHKANPGGLGVRPTIDPKSESKDYLAAVWLSISPKLGPIPYNVARLFGGPKDEKKIPMAFVYGEKDPGKRFSIAAATFLDPTWKKAKKGKKAKNLRIGAFTIDDSDKLRGRDLLSSSIGTVKGIADYLDGIVEDGLNEHETKEFKKQEYVWQVRPLIIKPAGEKTPVFLPPFP
jgi:hypothetical protein